MMIHPSSSKHQELGRNPLKEVVLPNKKLVSESADFARTLRKEIRLSELPTFCFGLLPNQFNGGHGKASLIGRMAAMLVALLHQLQLLSCLQG